MKFLQELLDMQHNDVDLVTSINAKSSMSNTLKVGDIEKADTPENKRIQRAIDELNKIIYDFGDDQNSPIYAQAVTLRDELKAQLDASVPDTEPATASVGRGLEPAIFHNIG
jgi:hypothetical protein